jgi:hypothetical protein
MEMKMPRGEERWWWLKEERRSWEVEEVGSGVKCQCGALLC